MAMVPPSAPRTNRTLSEMVPERCLTPALERMLTRRPGSHPRQSGRARRNGPDLFRAASSSMRRLGANCFPFRPNGVTIRSQGTKAPVKTLEARDRRSPLTTWRMARIAKGSYCRARCSQKQPLAQIAKSGGLRFHSELPAVLASGRTAGGGANAGALLPERGFLCATALT
jgi:hypothetical protein